MTSQIVLVGAGPLGLNAATIVRQLGGFELIGFLDSQPGTVAGIEILGDDSMLDELLAKGVRHAAVCIGASRRRVEIGLALRDRGFELPALVHPTAEISVGASVGTGVIVMHGAFVGPESTIADFSVIEASVFVGHHVEIGTGTLVSGCAIVGNRSKLGNYCTIGMASQVRNGTALPDAFTLQDFSRSEPKTEQ